MSAVVFSTVTKSYAFYGRHTAQTVLAFESRIEVSIKGLNDVNQLKAGAIRAKALEYVDLQLQHLMILAPGAGLLAGMLFSSMSRNWAEFLHLVWFALVLVVQYQAFIFPG